MSVRVLRPSRNGFVLRWTFIVATILFSLLLQSTEISAKNSKQDSQDFAEFDLDEDEFERGEANTANEDDFDDEEEVEMEDEEDEEDDPPERVVEQDDDDDEDEASVEAEFDNEFDDEEFENFAEDLPPKPVKGSAKKDDGPPLDLKIAKVPAHLINNWENYYLEMLMVAGLCVYFINFMTGKSKNYRIANTWFQAHKDLLEANFSLVGDDGNKNMDEIETQLVKDGEHLFSLWCSGRTGCEGMLVEIKLIKRQDMVAVISNMMKPAHDQISIKVQMNPEEMDSFVFCLAHKKAANKLSKEMQDLNTYCPEKRSAEKYGVPANFLLLSEIAEVSAAMMDPKMVAILNKYPNSVDSIHLSDQYTGLKPSDDQVLVDPPVGKKMMIFTFNIGANKGAAGQSLEDQIEDLKPLMLLVFYFLDKVRRYKLSREAKNKAEKNRAKVAEAFWKTLHASRAERAQEEREKKRRDIKERIKNIEDPEKQRKLEDRENRRDKKKNAPKMKQLKVKAM